jgi:hypothetical protein
MQETLYNSTEKLPEQLDTSSQDREEKVIQEKYSLQCNKTKIDPQEQHHGCKAKLL